MSTPPSVPFIEQAIAQVTVRPRKLGYLVHAGRAADIRKAIIYATSEWGGISHPIIQVRRGRDIDPGIWQILEVLRPEVLIDYAAVSERLEQDLRSRLSCDVIPESHLRFDEPGIHALASSPPGALRGCTLLMTKERSTLSWLASLGGLPEGPDARQPYEQLNAWMKDAESFEDLLDGQLSTPSPIWITKQQHETVSTAVIGSPVVVFVNPRPSPGRIVWFWNIRALAAGGHETHVLWMPIGALHESAIAAKLQALCRSKPRTEPDLILTDGSDAELDDAGRALGFELRTERKYTLHLAEAPNKPRGPLTYWRRVDPRVFLLNERSEGTRSSVSLTVTRPTTTAYIPSPVEFNTRIFGKIRLELDGVQAIDWPRRPQVASLIESNATWSSNGLGVITSPTSRFTLKLNIPEAADVLTACLSGQGWSWHISEKGRYAAALVAATPGRTSISALHSRLALRIIRSLGSLSQKKAEQALRNAVPSTAATDEKIRELVGSILPGLVPRWLPAQQIKADLSNESGRVTLSRILATLNSLIAEGLVVRAFRFTCQNCGLVTHLPLARTQDRVRCDGCAVMSPLQEGSEEPLLTYGLNTLLDRAVDQDCLGHLLTQDWIRTSLGAVFDIPGANVLRAEGSQREVDVLALSPAKLIVAEVKNAVGGFHDDAVLAAALLAKDLAADHLVLAALDDWSQPEEERVRMLSRPHVSELSVIGLDALAAPP